MKRNINAQARLVDTSHRRISLSECKLVVGEVRVDEEDRDVEVISIDTATGFATLKPIRGRDRTAFEARCSDVASWQLIGGFPDLEELQLVA